jgi:hypothetical protein
MLICVQQSESTVNKVSTSVSKLALVYLCSHISSCVSACPPSLHLQRLSFSEYYVVGLQVRVRGSPAWPASQRCICVSVSVTVVVQAAAPVVKNAQPSFHHQLSMTSRV